MLRRSATHSAGRYRWRGWLRGRRLRVRTRRGGRQASELRGRRLHLLHKLGRLDVARRRPSCRCGARRDHHPTVVLPTSSTVLDLVMKQTPHPSYRCKQQHSTDQHRHRAYGADPQSEALPSLPRVTLSRSHLKVLMRSPVEVAEGLCERRRARASSASEHKRRCSAREQTLRVTVETRG